VDDAAERADARRVRTMARLTWPTLAAALLLVLGPARVGGDAKVAVLAVVLGGVAALNVPSLRVVLRAHREGAPGSAVAALAVALGLRLAAAIAVAALLAGDGR
jgi:hypothetical protein